MKFLSVLKLKKLISMKIQLYWSANYITHPQYLTDTVRYDNVLVNANNNHWHLITSPI